MTLLEFVLSSVVFDISSSAALPLIVGSSSARRLSNSCLPITLHVSIGSRIIASTSISAIRKDVLAKCYGADISRKKKLLKK